MGLHIAREGRKEGSMTTQLTVEVLEGALHSVLHKWLRDEFEVRDLVLKGEITRRDGVDAHREMLGDLFIKIENRLSAIG